MDEEVSKSSDARLPLVAAVVYCIFNALTIAALTFTISVAAVADEQQKKQDDVADDKPASLQTDSIRWTGIPTIDLDNPELHRGVVLGPDGRPLAGASVYAASAIELLELVAADQVNAKSMDRVRAVTDAEGRFEFLAEDLTWVNLAGTRKRMETLLVATKEGLVAGWLKTNGDERSFRSHWHPHPSKEVALRMGNAANLMGQLSLNGGEPLAGALVRVTGLMAPFKYDLDLHIDRYEKKALGLFSGIDYAEELYRPWVLPGLTTEATTNDEGRFEISGLPEGFIVQVEITHPQIVTTELRAAIRSIEPVYRQPLGDNGTRELTLYGSTIKTELEKGIVLRGQVVPVGWGSKKKGVGVTVALANHNDPEGMQGKRFTTDSDGRFEVTGLRNRPEGYELAFVGSYAAPWCGHREKIFAGKDARVELTPAVPYRLTLQDPEGNAVDRKIHSIMVQRTPGMWYRDAKYWFNVPERVAPGSYRGIVPTGPAAVLIELQKGDRPVTIDPKSFFAPGRKDWTLEEKSYAYGDNWKIAGVGVSITDRLAFTSNPLYDQLDLAAAVFTNAREEDGMLELTAVVHPAPPVEFTLVDEAGEPVEKARVIRQMTRYNTEELPTKFFVHGLHPDRAEMLIFRQAERGLIAAITTTWTGNPVKVTMRPAATLRGRFVKESGELDFDFGARIFSMGVLPDTYVAGRLYNPTEKLGERKGEFELVVPPDVDLHAEFVRKSADWKTRPTIGNAFGPLTPKPGEIVDLGNIVVP